MHTIPEQTKRILLPHLDFKCVTNKNINDYINNVLYRL